MRASTLFNSIPSDMYYIWITHLPDFSIQNFKVTAIKHDKNGDILIQVADSPIWGNTIRAKKGGNGKQDWWMMKKSYHISEADAVVRLRDYYRKLNSEKVDTITACVASDAKNKATTLENIEKYVLNYPEMIL